MTQGKRSAISDQPWVGRRKLTADG